MVFDVKDGAIAQHVWDAVLYELMQPSNNEAFLKTKDEKHTKYKRITSDVLNNHVAKQLDELAALRTKLDQLAAEDSDNAGLIRQHNTFLTDVFTKVKENLHQYLK